MLWIYTDKDSPRFDYIRILLSSRTGLEIKNTSDEAFFDSIEGPKMTYCRHFKDGVLGIKAESTLFESYHPFSQPLSLKILLERGEAIKFEEEHIEHDVLASIFYLLSRQEEYFAAEFAYDVLGRFSHKHSILYKYGLHETPIVDIWIKRLFKAIKKKFKGIFIEKLSFEYEPTFDIDAAKAYQSRPLYYTLGSIGKKLLRGNYDEAQKQIKIYRHRQKDPLNTFDRIEAINKELGLMPYFFFHLGDFNRYDRNINWQKPFLQNLIIKLDQEYPTGIHPSFDLMEKPLKLDLEKKRLESIIPSKCLRARQHYIRFRIPDYYELLLKNRIKHDYSMGWTHSCGFRAGTSRAFYYYDFKNEQTTDLSIHPFCIMDSTLNHHLKLNPLEALDNLDPIIQRVKKAKGKLSVIFHNDVLSNWGAWVGWSDFYHDFSKRVLEK